MARIAHLSDLHLGASAATERAAHALAATLRDDRPEVVIVSGDVTDRARPEEAALFREIFGEFDPIVVPGNHDRLGPGLDSVFMNDRVELTHREGVSVLRIDSTGPHNTSMHTPQGMMTEADLAAVAEALTQMPHGVLRVATLHHHPIFLPEDNFWEKVGGWLGITRVEELHCGEALLALLKDHCDVVLSGHRHVPNQHKRGTLDVFTGGSATELGAYRVLTHERGVLRNVKWADAKVKAAVGVPMMTGTIFSKVGDYFSSAKNTATKTRSAARPLSAPSAWARASQPTLPGALHS